MLDINAIMADTYYYITINSIYLLAISTCITINLLSAEFLLYKTWRQKGFFQFEIIINVLGTCSSFYFIRIPMLWVYDQYQFFYSYSAVIEFIDVRILCLQSSDSETNVDPNTLRVDIKYFLHIQLIYLLLSLITITSIYLIMLIIFNTTFAIFNHKFTLPLPCCVEKIYST